MNKYTKVKKQLFPKNLELDIRLSVFNDSYDDSIRFFFIKSTKILLSMNDSHSILNQ